MAIELTTPPTFPKADTDSHAQADHPLTSTHTKTTMEWNKRTVTPGYDVLIFDRVTQRLPPRIWPLASICSMAQDFIRWISEQHHLVLDLAEYIWTIGQHPARRHRAADLYGSKLRRRDTTAGSSTTGFTFEFESPSDLNGKRLDVSFRRPTVSSSIRTTPNTRALYTRSIRSRLSRRPLPRLSHFSQSTVPAITTRSSPVDFVEARSSGNSSTTAPAQTRATTRR